MKQSAAVLLLVSCTVLLGQFGASSGQPRVAEMLAVHWGGAAVIWLRRFPLIPVDVRPTERLHAVRLQQQGARGS